MNLNTTLQWVFRLFLGFLIIGAAQAQTKKHSPRVIKKIPAEPTICKFVEEEYHTHVPLPEEVRAAMKNGRLEERSTFIPIYGGNFPDRYKPALEYAMSIWASVLPSDVEIYVQAQFIEQSEGTLASAGPTGFYLVEEGQEAAFYAAPLAEKITGRSINTNGEADIQINIGNRDDWYLGTDGQPGPREFDLATILLHELGHGLGFTGSASIDAATGSLGGALASDPESRFPFTYDVFIENGAGLNLFTEFPSPSTTLGSQFTGNDLFFNGPLLVGALGDRAKIFAPSPFNQGSSYSHLDEATYPAGDENSLMSPQVGFNEVIHDPGITLELFADLGWISTRIVHTPLGDTENSTTPYVVNATVLSDTTYDAAQVSLTYSYDAFTSSQTVVMTGTGNANEFTGEIPNGGDDVTISYYISVPDASGRTFTSPGAAPDARVHSFKVGNDTEAPVIEHDPIRFIVTTATTIDVIAAVSDNLAEALSTVQVQYSINGEEQTPLDMTLDPEPLLLFVDQTYSTAFTFTAGQLNEGDVLEYRIVAIDGSVNQNTTIVPEEGRFLVNIVAVSDVVDEYQNDFEDPTTASDFIGDDFIFDQPANFDDVALHSPHPYDFADNVGQSSINYIHQLNIPIRVKENFLEATLSFEEVVLVEPGDPGVPFGEAEFWDYVIVEGSNDKGATWRPFLEGYDSRADRAWESVYNNGIQGNDSQAEGNEGLFREREINLQTVFEAGDEVLIRFRLFSDPFARGWGWAIDNLLVQVPKPLEPPLVKQATNVTENSFTAGWFAAQNAESYLLDVSTDANFGSFLQGFNSKELTSFEDNVTGLESGTTYFYRLRSKAGDRISENFSEVVSVTTEGGTTTGIEDYVNENAFVVFPNPTDGQLSLDVEFVKPTETIKVRVTDLLGKTIMSETFQPTGLKFQTRVSLSGQASGMYLVSLEIDGGTLTKKVFLNR